MTFNKGVLLGTMHTLRSSAGHTLRPLSHRQTQHLFQTCRLFPMRPSRPLCPEPLGRGMNFRQEGLSTLLPLDAHQSWAMPRPRITPQCRLVTPYQICSPQKFASTCQAAQLCTGVTKVTDVLGSYQLPKEPRAWDRVPWQRKALGHLPQSQPR